MLAGAEGDEVDCDLDSPPPPKCTSSPVVGSIMGIRDDAFLAASICHRREMREEVVRVD